ncbi:MAG TPA: HPP family protein, partial [Candidatus Hydrogenedentes bacterium]|nr:HPP family protein [Candidatus Hydrogenedentota bacterium]
MGRSGWKSSSAPVDNPRAAQRSFDTTRRGAMNIGGTRLLDPKFRDNIGKYVAQCAVVVFVMLVVLRVLDVIADAAVVGALGASSFIAFCMPHARVASPRFLVGGYMVGILMGAACYFASTAAEALGVPLLGESPVAVFGALAVGGAIFVMVITNLEHPPAASLALGLVLNGCDSRSVLVVLV